MADFITDQWDQALPVLSEYIAIPARSPMFDPDWQHTGHLRRAAVLLRDWAAAQQVAGMTVELIEIEGLTPVLFLEVPATDTRLADHTVLVYGHLDKQPEMEPWSEGLGPWKPVRRGDRLYGRGGADDGYSVFGAVIALAAAQQRGIRHGRVCVLIEASEESSSVHLAEHLSRLLPRIGVADLVIGLDSFCETYDRLWTTTSTRGVCGGVLHIDICADDPHSGTGAGHHDPRNSAFAANRAVADLGQVEHQRLSDSIRAFRQREHVAGFVEHVL